MNTENIDAQTLGEVNIHLNHLNQGLNKLTSQGETMIAKMEELGTKFVPQADFIEFKARHSQEIQTLETLIQANAKDIKNLYRYTYLAIGGLAILEVLTQFYFNLK